MAPLNLHKDDNALGSNSTSRITPNAVNRARELQALGNLCSINPESHSIPVPTSYLNPMSTQPSIRYGPPPLPPRAPGTYPTNYSTGYSRMGGMGSYYSPYSRYSSFGGYGGYSSPYGGGYRFGGSPMGGYSGPGENSFIQMAEESTRPAFESIEGVVEVVSSISMMLESTYHAVHSSYSAILGVVDQFSRLKDHLAQILSVLALLRALRWLCLKVLYLLGLRKENPSVDAAWNNAERLGVGGNAPDIPGKPQVSAWPFLMFVGLVIGAPWLMFKLLSKSVVTKKVTDENMFVDENGRKYAATAAYDFNATRPGELSFQAGEKLFLSAKASNSKGWIYACNNKKETGLIPYNYLASKMKGRKPELAYQVYPAQQRESAIPENTPFQVEEPSPNSISEPPVPSDEKKCPAEGENQV